jgi:hypothetical protein
VKDDGFLTENENIGLSIHHSGIATGEVLLFEEYAAKGIELEETDLLSKKMSKMSEQVSTPKQTAVLEM